jgi:hypothetical protein
MSLPGLHAGTYPLPRANPTPVGAERVQSGPIPGARPPVSDRDRVTDRLKNFQYRTSQPWLAITKRFGPHLGQVELLSLADIIQRNLTDVAPLDREAKRRKEVLIKWFDENWAPIEGFLPRVSMTDADGNPLPGPNPPARQAPAAE